MGPTTKKVIYPGKVKLAGHNDLVRNKPEELSDMENVNHSDIDDVMDDGLVTPWKIYEFDW